MDYRILWTWDSWVCDPFSADSYITEYKKLIDFAARTGYNGIIIWGFLDDRHGGIDAAKRIAEYGKQKGVKILPGVGAGGYNGFFISEGSPYNINSFLKDHPELRARVRVDNQMRDHVGCLYQEEFQEWLREGSRWLAENFDIGGVNIETNEMDLIDICEHAESATRQEPNRLKYAASFSDLAIAVPIIHSEISRVHPDAWVTYATYEPAWFDRQEDCWLLKNMPRDAIAQWNMELDVRENAPPPVEKNISLIHSGGWSYHLAAFPPTWAFTQFRCFYPVLEEAKRFAVNQHAMRMNGFALGNVGSADMPDNEINCIAYQEFSRNPEMTVEDFCNEFLSDLYGSDAGPIVAELMLKQTSVHQSVAPVWRGWAWLLYRGEVRDQLLLASEKQIESLTSQLVLAQKALNVSNESGRQRLELIIEILKEYRLIAELSNHPELQVWIERQHSLEPDELALLDRQVSKLAEENGLPDDIYCYSPERRKWSAREG